jgi:hypothetical protein
MMSLQIVRHTETTVSPHRLNGHQILPIVFGKLLLKLMTLKQPSSFFGVLTGIGAAASIGAAWFQPTAFAPILAASGGVLFGGIRFIRKEKTRRD